MTLHILGTASGVPSLTRAHAAVLVRGDGDSVLLDAGEGVSQAFFRYGIPWQFPRAVYISHTHADHVSGLPMLLQAMHIGGRNTDLDLYVPPGRTDWFTDWLRGMYMPARDWSFNVRLCEFDTAGTDARLQVAALRNGHLDTMRARPEFDGVPADAYSFLVRRGDRSVLVSSDIGTVDDVRPTAARVQLLLLDVTHVSVRDAETLMEGHSDLHIVATHIPPELEEAAATGRSVLRWARDGMRIHIDKEIRYE